MSDSDRPRSPFAGMADFSARPPVRVLSPDQIEQMLEEHQLYLETEYHQGHRANFASADLSQRDFSGRNLRAIKMDCAVLKGANFIGARLQSANLVGAILHGARFDGADLSGARLSGANLVSANLQNACLAKADMEFAAGARRSLGGAVGRDAQGSSTSRQLPVISLSGPIPVPQCRLGGWRPWLHSCAKHGRVSDVTKL